MNVDTLADGFANSLIHYREGSGKGGNEAMYQHTGPGHAGPVPAAALSSALPGSGHTLSLAVPRTFQVLSGQEALPSLWRGWLSP